MKNPIFNILSLAFPSVVGIVGYQMARSAKGATNMGEALGPYFALAMILTIAAAIGELPAIVSLLRGERLAWMGIVTNGLLLLPTVYLLLIADWR